MGVFLGGGASQICASYIAGADLRSSMGLAGALLRIRENISPSSSGLLWKPEQFRIGW